jgi:hypothetical protein
MEKKQYIVMVDDNYHYMDEDERYQAGVYDTLEGAVRRCKSIIRACIEYEEGVTPDELFAQYSMYGDDPFIIGDGSFCGRTYAREYCERLCKIKNK